MSRTEQHIYIPNESEFPTPDFPKQRGNEVEQRLTKSPFPILQKFHNDAFHGYPSTSAAQIFGALRFQKYPERYDKGLIEKVVHRTFVRCGLEQSGDNRNTVRGNASKSTPVSRRAKEYPLPKWTFHKFALQYLHRVADVVESEIAAERRAAAEQHQEQSS